MITMRKIPIKFEVDMTVHCVPSNDAFVANALRDLVTLSYNILTLKSRRTSIVTLRQTHSDWSSSVKWRLRHRFSDWHGSCWRLTLPVLLMRALAPAVCLRFMTLMPPSSGGSDSHNCDHRRVNIWKKSPKPQKNWYKRFLNCFWYL